jgi:protein O-mannosyl-transferase
MTPPSPTLEAVLANIGRTALQLNRAPEAVDALQYLVVIEPNNREATYFLGMAYLMKGDPRSAWQWQSKLIAEAPSGRAYYARALANYALKRKGEALSDIENAIRLGPDNPNLREWHSKITAMP